MGSETAKCVQAPCRKCPRVKHGAGSWGAKAPYADNGCSIVKYGNAAWTHLAVSLRAGWQDVIHGVAPLAKGPALHDETRLMANALPTR